MDTLHIYTRVSTSFQEEEGTSLDTQKELGIKKAKELGMTPVLHDEGGASSKGDDLLNRPILAAILRDIEAGEIKQLFVYAPDRLSRNETTWSAIRLRLVKHRVTLHSAGGVYDLSNPTDKLMLGVLAEFSSFENSQRTARMRDGKLRRLKDGGWYGGTPPFGYRILNKKLVPDPDEAKVVRSVFEQFVDGVASRKIRDSLIRNGARPRRGKIWSLGSLDGILKNSHYRGTFSVTDKFYGETVRATCEPLLSPSLIAQFDEAVLRRRYVRSGESNLTNFYLLRGLLACGHCGSLLCGREYRTQSRSVYYCARRERLKNDPFSRAKKLPRCEPGLYLQIKTTDETIWNTVVDVMEKSHLFRESIKTQNLTEEQAAAAETVSVESLNAQVRKIEAESAEFKSMIAGAETDRIIGRQKPEVAAMIVQNLEEEVEKLEAKRSELIGRLKENSKAKRWRNWLEDFGDKIEELKSMAPASKRKFLDGAIDRITAFSLGNNRYRCVLSFRAPYVQDRLVKSVGIGGAKKATKFTVEAGRDELELEMLVAQRKPKKNGNQRL